MNRDHEQLLLVLLAMVLLSGCATVSEKYGEFKSRTIIGIGVTKSGANWYGPITFSIADEPPPESNTKFQPEIIPTK